MPPALSQGAAGLVGAPGITAASTDATAAGTRGGSRSDAADGPIGQPGQERPDDAMVGWAIVRAEEHLRTIRSYVGFLVLLAVAGVIAGIIVAFQAAEDVNTGF